MTAPHSMDAPYNALPEQDCLGIWLAISRTKFRAFRSKALPPVWKQVIEDHKRMAQLNAPSFQRSACRVQCGNAAALIALSIIQTSGEQNYEEFQEMADQGSHIDAHTAQVDALVAEVLQISLLESQKKSDFGQYLLPCGTRCPTAKRPQLEDLMKRTGVPNSEDELELLFGVGGSSKSLGIFLLTSKALYTPNDRIALQDIRTLEVKGRLITSIIVNGIEITCPYDTQIRQEFCRDLKEKIVPLMKERFG